MNSKYFKPTDNQILCCSPQVSATSRITMDWTAVDISNYRLRWYELAAIRARKKSNRYTTFLRCACKEYHFADDVHKREIIALVTGMRTIYPTDITCMALVRRCWNNMDIDLKEEWNLRSNFINGQPRRGLFNHLPQNAPADSSAETRVCCRMECDAIIKLMRDSYVFKEKVPPSTQKITACFPQKVHVGERVFAHIPMSPYIRRRIFHERLRNLPLSEIWSSNPKNDPGYAHFASAGRAEQVLKLSDVNFIRYEDLRNESTIILTSTAILLNSAYQSLKVYGWDESDDSITYIYFDGEGTPGVFITMPKPEFLVSESTGRGRRRIRTYVFPEEQTLHLPYRYSEYTPICVSVTSRRVFSVKILAA